MLYWRQQSQRVECNDVLAFTVQRANRAGNPLVVGFGRTENYPDANFRHVQFMLEGVWETAESLRERGIAMVVREGDPAAVAAKLASAASEVICDVGYLRHQRAWRKTLAEAVDCTCWQVESDVLVPAAMASPKLEYAARTIRPKLQKLAARYLRSMESTPLENASFPEASRGLDLDRIEVIVSDLQIDRSVQPVQNMAGGTGKAMQRLADFLANRFSAYPERSAMEISVVHNWGLISTLGKSLPLPSHSKSKKPSAMFRNRPLPSWRNF
jgi:deoxyribodipyrimidine photo-lyase